MNAFEDGVPQHATDASLLHCGSEGVALEVQTLIDGFVRGLIELLAILLQFEPLEIFWSQGLLSLDEGLLLFSEKFLNRNSALHVVELGLCETLSLELANERCANSDTDVDTDGN